MRKLTLPFNIYEQYKKEVGGNEDVSYLQTELKFTRNMRLGLMYERSDGRGYYIQYGKLHFIINEKDVIVWMKNNCPRKKGWKRNERRYLELNKELGIEADERVLMEA